MPRPTQLQLLAGAASVLFWAIPGIAWLLLPLEYLNTHIHELGHALAAVATGGDVVFIKVFASGGGVTPVLGGNTIALASAGYVGAAFAGGFLLYFGRSEKGSRTLLVGLAALLGLALLLWVRGDAVGVISGFVWIGLLLAMARGLKGDALIFAAQFLGIQQCLHSVQSLYTLLQINALTSHHNDAKVAEMATGVPSLAWALLWFLVSLAWMVVAIRSGLPRRPRTALPSG
jgi:hypothetical protein